MASSIKKLKGYYRDKDLFGIRNHIIVLSSVCCANSIARSIAALDKETIPILHQHGCDLMGEDREQVLRTLVGICNNPNVGGILLVGLGCESTSVNDITRKINPKNKIVRELVIQEIGSYNEIIREAKRKLAEIKDYVLRQKKETFDISNLIVGLECGGSDIFSGLTANPSIGILSDRLVKLSATVILAEVPEMIGAEQVLAERVADEQTKNKLLAKIKRYISLSKEMGSDLTGVNPTPGNVRAGISSIEEKSLGCIEKGGHSKIKEVVDYAVRPSLKGLLVMDTPGNDPESITGMAAGGAQLVIFTTGLGTPLGCPVAPIIKVSSNSQIFNHMQDFIDIDAGRAIKGYKLEQIADELFNLMVEVCNGRKTKSEVWAKTNGFNEFSINRIGPTF